MTRGVEKSINRPFILILLAVIWYWKLSFIILQDRVKWRLKESLFLNFLEKFVVIVKHQANESNRNRIPTYYQDLSNPF